jgi:hypothetical protein
VPDQTTSCVDAFVACVQAANEGVLIERASRQDKEFHFQNWLDARLTDAGLAHDPSGRNTYPDFTLVHYPEGYEVKGLAWPGREASYDSNSRVPSGEHSGRTVFYVFGRYPANVVEDAYPLVDLVICHGDFLNADHTYVHKNKSFKGFGSYGDILVRDRKMYVAPTPFALTEGTTGQKTLIVPKGLINGDPRVEEIGELVRVETSNLVVGYTFDLRENELTPQFAPNPSAGAKHTFTAFRLKGPRGAEVRMRELSKVEQVLAEVGEE